MARKPQLEIAFRTWGGRRNDAGRKPRDPRRPSTPHTARPAHSHGDPVHVTLRARRRAPRLRAELPFCALRAAIAKASRDEFRVLHFSVQADHVHLIVEAGDRRALSRGVQGLAIRLARGLNREIGRRGPLWGDRWNGRALKTPREVRHTLVYVLANARKHREDVGPLDACSSAAWFDGWADAPAGALESLRARAGPEAVHAPRTWLARTGWRRHGLLSVWEAPAFARG
jgi:REP element-mobilizing transposase RayT